MTTPVVVQGTPVAQPAPFQTSSAPHDPASNQDRESKVETKCNDPIFAVLFYITAIAIFVVAIMYGPEALSSSTSNSGKDYSGYMIAAAILTIISFCAAALGLWIMMCIPQTLIKAALILSVVLSAIWAIVAFLGGQFVIGIIGVIFFAMSCCYAYFAWSRIPFATANLVTAITAIKANCGIVIYTYLFAALSAGWLLVWSLCFVGVFDKTYSCDAAGNCSNPSYGYLFLLFLALYFVSQAIQGSIHCTIAGTVGTWWYAPDECGCCSSAVNHSLIRTLTTSFGSICFGSLLVAIVQALRSLADQAQQNGDAQILACIAECILACLASILEYFNKWAFIYVGLYGMPYLKAGKSVIELFQNRGWEAVIADDLVDKTLFLVSLLAGAVTGCIGIAIAAASTLMDEAGGDKYVFSFVIGLVIGTAISLILNSTISSGVNAVIVLFAEGPAEFQRNHPELSNKMREVWNQIYPGSV